LRELVGSGAAIVGQLRPGEHAQGQYFCDADVLRRIKRRSLAKLRHEIAAVDAATFARFLPAWQGVGDPAHGPARLLECIATLEGLPIAYSELEQSILPARVPGFHTRMLDELGAQGEIVWVGHGALGPGDGRIALYRRDRVGALLDAAVVPEGLDDVRRAILDHLGTRGASFVVELQRAAGADVRLAELEEALWDLVWAGLVTNDTMLPLRAFVGGAKGRAQAALRTGGGRWSLVRDLIGPEVGVTERALARAQMLLARYGLVSRDVLSLEAIEGGFAPISRVLRELEDHGKVRRGWFVEGLGGSQFAAPGAVDRLRTLRQAPSGTSLVLAATDPAQPWGAMLPWPLREGSDRGGGPRRSAGASVVSVDGMPVLWIERGGKRLVTFPAADDAAVLQIALRGLAKVAEQRRGKTLRIETIDGEPARTSRFSQALRAADFEGDVRGLTLEVR
ncbi:MAG TPA: hypothetical protein VG755_25175, partial [Nannocystaceae bacterium]|nr:hypothetical protein [Nannocystaceae bacterium]